MQTRSGPRASKPILKRPEGQVAPPKRRAATTTLPTPPQHSKPRDNYLHWSNKRKATDSSASVARSSKRESEMDPSDRVHFSACRKWDPSRKNTHSQPPQDPSGVENAFERPLRRPQHDRCPLFHVTRKGSTVEQREHTVDRESRHVMTVFRRTKRLDHPSFRRAQKAGLNKHGPRTADTRALT